MEHPLQELAQAAEKTSESEQMETTEIRGSADDEIVAEDSDRKPFIEDDACDTKPSRSHSSEIITVVDESPEMCVICKVNPVYYIPHPDLTGKKLPRSKSDDTLGMTTRRNVKNSVCQLENKSPLLLPAKDATCDSSLTASIQREVSQMKTVDHKICFTCKLKMEDSTSQFDISDKTPEPTNNTKKTTTTVVEVDVHRPPEDSSSRFHDPLRCANCKRRVKAKRSEKAPRHLVSEIRMYYVPIDMEDMRSTTSDEASSSFVEASSKQLSTKADQIDFMIREGEIICEPCERSMKYSIQVCGQESIKSCDLEQIEMEEMRSTEHSGVGAHQAEDESQVQADVVTSGIGESKQPKPSPIEINNTSDLECEDGIVCLSPDESTQEGSNDEDAVRETSDLSAPSESSTLLLFTPFSVSMEMAELQRKKRRLKILRRGFIIFCLLIGISGLFAIVYFVPDMIPEHDRDS